MTATTQSNNKRIARNTLFMYLRMGATMIVQLYTSRIVLDALGIDNYGIYNIVASVVILFTFIGGPLSAATQRFFNYELGLKNGGDINKVFNLVLLAYAALTVFLVLIIEIGGGWYVANRLNIPPGSLEASKWVFQLSILSLAFSLMRTPLESLIIAYERMDYYAYLSIAEVFMKLANALSLTYVACDKLKLYAFNSLAISIIFTACVAFYCHRQFKEIRIRRTWDRNIFRSLLSFSGWTMLSSVTTMGATNGVNVLLNAFCGVAVNSAMGVATQVSTAINQFVTNFQVAFNPQIVKYYSSGDIRQMQLLAYRAAKISYLLLLMIVCPLFFNMDFILGIWLKEVPPYTAPLCLGLIVWSLLESLMAPLWTSVTATGRIKTYHIVMSIIISMVFLLSWAALAAGFSPVSVVVVKCGVDVVLIITRLLFTRRLLDFSVRRYISQVIAPAAIMTLTMAAIMYALETFGTSGWLKIILAYGVDLLLFIPLAGVIALSHNERTATISLIKTKLHAS